MLRYTTVVVTVTAGSLTAGSDLPLLTCMSIALTLASFNRVLFLQLYG